MQQAEMYAELRFAIEDLSLRGLFVAARWAAEQLNGFEEVYKLKGMAVSVRRKGFDTLNDTCSSNPSFMLAKSHFEFKEYGRASYALHGVPGPAAQFLRLYAAYLAGEKKKNQERMDQGGFLGANLQCVNPDLDELEICLEQISKDHAEEGLATDPFILYLHGLVLLERRQTQAATKMLVQSVNAYPCNWSAWQALRYLCNSLNAVQKLDLPNHWVRDFFLASVLLDLQQNQEAMGRLQRLSQMFPNSVYMESLVAQVHYNLQNYDEAQSLYEDILSKDPFRLEGMDVFSNILFVKEQAAALSQLAHRATATDKYSPEACCIVGNYFSLKAQHEKAVEYFQRALKLNPDYLAAWTLMGHEYMEMKNTSAAVEAYRRAVNLCPSDFRAWYGLGQAYELLKMPYYAIYYHRRATALRPTDARMWCALGQCYASDQVSLTDQAIRCYRRAVEYNDPDGIAAHALASLYESREEYDAAEQLYRYNLARLEAAGNPLGADAVEALIFLGNRCKETGRLHEALQVCERLMDVGGPAKERAKSLAREVNSLIRNHSAGIQAVANQVPLTHQASSSHLSSIGARGTNMLKGQPSFDDFNSRMEIAIEEGPCALPVDTTVDCERAASRELQSSDSRHKDHPLMDGLDDYSIMGVMEQLQVSRATAGELIRKAGGDPVRAISANMHLT
ncbi:hypothetical protein CEUSTIGMA_g12820.t1 [Chlamydomonas eustigma]|uniref:Cdc23 domain-containing protein n=1 Tax=Chlamydomonas eustigma TaxID=1157962 RepID=A0A250XQR7_9CHLO|nr:hypothetical protein CEUSTIGMA_g12820.t1 [Chlamydomonas eustigma]|eukprot:GAX85404.1 hypothetical protein CEUSTIGMA_g12820.t1 [Chlamydomonas eustigma]